MGKIKVLHMTPPDVNNGVHKYIFNHMQYINTDKLEFAFLSKSAAELRLTNEYKKYGFKLYTLHNTERGNKEGLRREVIDILEEGYDAIHLHTSSWRGFFIEEIAMERGVKQVIVHSHSTGIDEIDDLERKKRIEIHNIFKERFSMKYATDICACSKLAGNWLFGNQIPESQIKIMPNAIDVNKYHFDEKRRQKVRTLLNLDNRVIVGSVGRYCYQKNQEFLMYAFAKAYKKNSSLFLLCIGHGENKEMLDRLAEQLGIKESILLLDWQNNIEDYLQGMDVFCLPSRFEGLPISAIEAQAAGLKCFISDTVTREVSITSLVAFLPLLEEMWVDRLTKCKLADKRGWYDRDIADAGFDVRAAGKRLEELYEVK